MFFVIYYTGLIMSEHNKNYIKFQNAFVLHDVSDIILTMSERNEHYIEIHKCIWFACYILIFWGCKLSLLLWDMKSRLLLVNLHQCRLVP